VKDPTLLLPNILQPKPDSPQTRRAARRTPRAMGPQGTGDIATSAIARDAGKEEEEEEEEEAAQLLLAQSPDALTPSTRPSGGVDLPFPVTGWGGAGNELPPFQFPTDVEVTTTSNVMEGLQAQESRPSSTLHMAGSASALPGLPNDRGIKAEAAPTGHQPAVGPRMLAGRGISAFSADGSYVLVGEVPFSPLHTLPRCEACSSKRGHRLLPPAPT
jgi:hypothetical protein